MKRIISTLLFCTLLLASCGSTVEPQETTKADGEMSDSTQPAETDRLDALGEKDLGGREFVIMDANDYPTTSSNVYDEERIGDAVNDAVHMRDTKIGNRFNTKITYLRPDSAGAGCKQISQGYLAGDKVCDLVFSTSADTGTLLNLISQGMLADLNSISYLSFDKPWWSRFAYDNLTFGGKTFMAIGEITATTYNAPVIMYGNLNLLDKYTPETDIFGLVNDGKWTIDRLLEYTKFNDDLDGDGKLHTGHDFFGYVGDSTGSGLSAGAFVVAGGVDLCTNNGDEITIDLVSDRAVKVVEKLAQLMPKERMDDRREYLNGTFKTGRAIFIQSYMGGSLRDMEDDFAIIPLPKFDEAQEDYKCQINGWGACATAVPDNADVDESGFIMEALAYEAYGTVRPEIYDKLLKQKLARDERTTAMIDLIFSDLTIDFNALCDFGGTLTVVANAVYKDKPLASNIAKKQSAADEAIAKFITGWMQE